MRRYLALAVLTLAPFAFAQGLKLTVFDRLKDKASDHTEVNLPTELIKLASGILGNADADAAKVKKLVAGLSSVLVKSLEFDKEGVYSDTDVKLLISELAAPGWKLVISADEKKEKSRIWMKSGANGDIGGLRIMSAEPKELTVVEIIGNVRPEDLKELGGLGIPDILGEHGQTPTKKEE